eukprot:CAMPEP_0182417384 /NCGR_PEP_ID=MMETSP1167-20130531/1844_1 /TAXON_ID=2988 /ORGANISM="Mallomonas Sp, Strain CCMP3275" /LENGTH=219 /DNA_ID=CAMNT_0024590909 /DNA_START=120 /DNA_END=776 /DNA_ORIENTATION=+
MGASASMMKDLSQEKQFELFQQLRKAYDDEVLGSDESSSRKHSYEDYLAWKDRLESMILNLSEPLSPRSAAARENTAEHEITADAKRAELLRYVDGVNHLSIGDVVRAKDRDTMTDEGLIVEIIGGKLAMIDFGDMILQYPLEDCTLMISGVDFEMHDKVQVKPKGMSLYFTGTVIAINADKTMDIQMDGDDPDDVETGVATDQVVKLHSCRPLALGHW